MECNGEENLHTDEPDLSIESVIPDKTQLKENEEINVTVTVRNDGDEEANWVDVYYQINGEDQYFRTIDEIEAGANETLTYRFSAENEGKYELNFIGEDDGTEFDRESVDVFVETSTIYVDNDAPDGGDGSEEHPYNTIQEGIDAAESGDRIKVYDGHYNETIIIDKSVGVEAEGTDCIIDGKDQGHVVLIQADGSTFRGFTIQGGMGYAGIFVQAGDTTIRNNHIEQCKYGIKLDTASDNQVISNTCTHNSDDGIHLKDAERNLFFQNTCEGNGNAGIWIRSPNNEIYDNICSGNENYGINIYTPTSTQTDSNVIEGNEISGSPIAVYLNNVFSLHFQHNSMNDGGLYPFFISVSEWERYRLSGNTVNDNPLHVLISDSDVNVPEGQGQIILINCSGITVEDQQCDRASIGIFASQCNNITILDSTCDDGLSGIKLYFSPDSRIEGNQCSGNSDYGIVVEWSDNTTVLNNVAEDNRIGTRIFNLFASRVEGNSFLSNEEIGLSFRHVYTTSVKNNQFRENEVGLFFRQTSQRNPIHLNTFSSNEIGIHLEFNASNNEIFYNHINENEIGIQLHANIMNVTVFYNDLSDNLNYAIYIDYILDKITTATYNWWGHSTGPYQENTNPSGEGDQVTNKVVYDPWLSDPVDTPSEVLLTVPEDGESDVFIDSTMEIRFSKPMDVDSLEESLDVDFDHTTAWSGHPMDLLNTVLRIEPGGDLQFDTYYSIDFDSTPVDVFGIPIASWSEISFKTESLFVEINSPDPDTTVKDRIMIKGTASPLADEVMIKWREEDWISVDSFENGYHPNGNRESGDWQYRLDIEDISDGPLTLSVRCTVDDQYSGIRTLDLIADSNYPPEVTYVDLEEHYLFDTEHAIVHAGIQDANGLDDIQSVFLVLQDSDGNTKDSLEIPITDPISYSYDLPDLAKGTYTLKIIVYDRKGTTGEDSDILHIKKHAPTLEDFTIPKLRYEEGKPISFTAEMTIGGEGSTEGYNLTIRVEDYDTEEVLDSMPVPMNERVSYSYTPDVGPGKYTLALELEGESSSTTISYTITIEEGDGDKILGLSSGVFFLIVIIAAAVIVGYVTLQRSNAGGTPYQPPPRKVPGRRPLCPQCGHPAVFYEEYGQHYCHMCSQYLSELE